MERQFPYLHMRWCPSGQHSLGAEVLCPQEVKTAASYERALKQVSQSIQQASASATAPSVEMRSGSLGGDWSQRPAAGHSQRQYVSFDA